MVSVALALELGNVGSWQHDDVRYAIVQTVVVVARREHERNPIIDLCPELDGGTDLQFARC